jgi:transcriptional regulator with XRE-family HTH domain
MKERLIEFLKAENKSSSQFAEEIGVQPSGISHILSGRNNPSLDFIMKMLEKYKFLSTEWLLFGKGSMYKEVKMQTLFEEKNAKEQPLDNKISEDDQDRQDIDIKHDIKDGQIYNLSDQSINRTSGVVKIVWFYENMSFEEYYPRK